MAKENSKNILYILKLSNEQDNYARCIQLLLTLENKTSPQNRVIWEESLEQFKNKGMDIYHLSYNDEEFNSGSEFGSGRAIKDKISGLEGKSLFGDSSKLKKFIEQLNKNGFSNDVNRKYLLIINVSKDISEFFYFALMLQALESQGFPLNNLFTCLVPVIENSKDLRLRESNDLYFKLSQYFANITFKEVYFQDDSKIKKLNKKTDSSTAFIPILPINSETLDKIFNSCAKLSYVNQDKIYGKDGEKINKATDKAIINEIRVLCHMQDDAEDAIVGMLKKFGTSKLKESIIHNDETYRNPFKKDYKNRELFFNTLVDSANGISWFQYTLLFMMIDCDPTVMEEAQNIIEMSEEENDIKTRFKNFWDKYIEVAVELSDAVYQLAENIVNHTDRKQGLLSVYVTEYGEQRKQIKTRIADINLKTIVETFKSDQKKCPSEMKEIKICTEDFLTPIADLITNENKTEWVNFRYSNPEKCQGLLKFSTYMSDLGCEARYKSSGLYVNREEDFWRVSRLENGEGEEISKLNDIYLIPGTQIDFSFTRVPKKNRSGDQTHIHRHVFSEYSDLLDLPENAYIHCYFNCKIDDKDLKSKSGQELKDGYVEKYKKLWLELFQKHSNLECLMITLNGADGLSSANKEALCKGLLSACNEYVEKGNRKKVELAFLNVSRILYSQMRITLQFANDKVNEFFRIRGKIDNSIFDNSFRKWESLADVLSKNEDFLFRRFIDEDNKFKPIATVRKLIKDAAQKSLLSAGDDHGYKLVNTHMRLGSKVHLEVFYQMSTFFKKHNVAMQTAFVLCRQILADETFLNNIKKATEESPFKIMLYGYEVYSRHIVFCMSEILTDFFKKKKYNAIVEFALYQSERIDELKKIESSIYFSNETHQKKVESSSEKAEKLKEDFESYKWILIVPISTTLTTFNKMWSKVNSVYRRRFMENDQKLSDERVLFNLTAFWVVSDSCASEKLKPDTIEGHYWKKADINSGLIEVDSSSNPLSGKYMFLACAQSQWHDPLSCTKCFPDRVIDELPLLETDVSSTVPEQQYYIKGEEPVGLTIDCCADNINDLTSNDRRILALQDCVWYGHYSRSGNHFLYYIDFPKYFQAERKSIKEWLELGREKKSDDVALLKLYENLKKKKNIIIVTSQNNADIEFGLYICNYLCDGKAETINIDANKHFRTNLEAEYSDIRYNRKDCYYLYVDTSIVSGRSIKRISSVMSSIANKRNCEDDCGKFSFDGLILLVNRISKSSGAQYIGNEGDFVSYVKIDVPHLRTHGDSCIRCKLQRQYENALKKAATPAFFRHYEKKLEDNKLQYFSEVSCSNENMNSDNLNKGYVSLIISHFAQRVLKPVRGCDNTTYVSVIKSIFDAYDSGSAPLIQELSKRVNLTQFDYIDYVIRILGRPFFSYDFALKKEFMHIVLCITEILLLNPNWFTTPEITMETIQLEGKQPNGIKKEEYDWIVKNICGVIISGCHQQKENVESISDYALEFIVYKLFKCLMKLNSNYLLRKSTIQHFLSFMIESSCSREVCAKCIEKYFFYTALLLKIGGDDSKSYRYEHLLYYGNEYSTDLQHNSGIIDTLDVNKFAEIIGVKKLINYSNKKEVVEDFLNGFWQPLIVENSSVVYHALEDIGSEKDVTKFGNEAEILSIFKDEYKFASDIIEKPVYSLFNNLLKQGIGNDVNKKIRVVHILLSLYYICKCGSDGKSLARDMFFTLIRDAIKYLVNEYFDIKNAQIFILGDKSKNENNGSTASETIYSIVGDYGIGGDSEQIIKEFKNNFINTSSHLRRDYDYLNKYGFWYSRKNKIIVLCIGKSDENIETPYNRIDTVYVYIKLDNNKLNNNNQLSRDGLFDIKCLHVAKNVLAFRYSLLEVIKEDLDTDFMRRQYNLGIAAKLATIDKAGDHTSTSEFDALYAYLKTHPECVDFEEKNEKSTEWLLLYSYVNRKIARLYNRMISERYLEEKSLDNDTLYIIGDENGDECGGFALAKFNVRNEGAENEGLKKEGQRGIHQIFKTIMQIVRIEVEDQSFKDGDNAIEVVDALRNCFDFIGLKIDKELDLLVYYNIDYFVVSLLDFCYSAITAMIEKNHLNEITHTSAVGKYQYLFNNNLSCKIKICREQGGEFNGEKFDYLVFQDEYNITKEAKIAGMSLQSISWYYDYLWRRYYYRCRENREDVKIEEIPKVIVEPDEQNDSAEQSKAVFKIKLPILKPKCDSKEVNHE
ncbi:MAG: hypothetical protein J1F71_00240 [Clostridiales bacterium]|nr:hypothetical protein [Clostridiales bacterium]